MSDRDKTLLDMKMNLNSMMKMCFISAVIVELFLNFGLFSGICNNKNIFSFLNLCYWIMAIALLFSDKRIIGIIIITLGLLKCFVCGDNPTFQYFDKVISLTNIIYIGVTTVFFEKIKYRFAGRYL